MILYVTTRNCPQFRGVIRSFLLDIRKVWLRRSSLTAPRSHRHLRLSGPFSLAVALSSLLLTAIIAQSIWESYYPPYAREALKQRKDYYEKVLLKADISWKEGLYYKVMEVTPKNQ